MQRNNIEQYKNSVSLNVRWILEANEVWIGNFYNKSDLENYIPEHFGSIQFLWSDDDTFLFSKSNNDFKIGIFDTSNICITNKLFKFKELHKGMIKYIGAKEFNVKSAEITYYTQLDELISFTEINLEANKLLELEICNDFSILFDVFSNYKGWKLRNSSLYISDGEFVKTRTINNVLKTYLYKYIDVCYNLNSAMKNKKEIKNLIEDMSQNQNSQIKTIRKCLENIYSFYYS